MSEEDVERFTADLLLAAIDTTAVTALWLIYVLASQQEVQVEQWILTRPRSRPSGSSSSSPLSRRSR
jgi:hypothetical protein